MKLDRFTKAVDVISAKLIYLIKIIFIWSAFLFILYTIFFSSDQRSHPPDIYEIGIDMDESEEPEF